MMQLLPYFQEDKNSNRPLPELIASGGNDWNAFSLAYVDADGVRYYAVQDWIAGVAKTEDTNNFWRALVKRYPELRTRCTKLPYKATNGRTYQMDHTDAEGLYAITQRMGANTGIAQRIMDYLSAAGVKMDEYRINPSAAIDAGTAGMLAQGVEPEKVKVRAKGIVSRNEFTTVAEVTNINGKPNYMALTTQEYKVLFGRGKSAIVAELKLSDAQAKHFRDHLDTLALQALEVIESTTAKKMQQVGRLLTDNEQSDIITQVAKLVAPSFNALAEFVGADLATGKPLLNNGSEQ